MLIDHKELSNQALEGVIESFIHREGTDYGDVDYSLTEKVQQVKSQLNSGKVVLVYDEASESINLMSQYDANQRLAES